MDVAVGNSEHALGSIVKSFLRRSWPRARLIVWTRTTSCPCRPHLAEQAELLTYGLIDDEEAVLRAWH